MKSINDIIRENILALRKSKNLTQEQLSEMVNLSKNTICNIESETIEHNTTINTIDNIAKVLGVPAYSLLVDKDDLTEIVADKNYKERISSTYYPPVAPYNNISALMEFLIYLPLINYSDLYKNLLYRVAGSIFNSESYISSLIDTLVKRIPNSHEKEFADFTFSKIRAIREGNSRDNVISEFEQEIPTLENEYDAYLNVITNKQAKFDMLNNFIDNWNKSNL